MEQIYDLLGIGFGPANLALACAIDDWNATHPPAARISATFVERAPAFSWHDDMLLPDAKCQVAFIKDLATPRDPTSRFSFLAYLHHRGRLHDFFDLHDVVPSRLEFHDYFSWAADLVTQPVLYGTEALAVTAPDDGSQAHVGEWVTRLRYRATGQEQAIRSRNVVVATGGTPQLPEGTAATSRVFHSSKFLSAIRSSCPNSHRAYSIVIVGGGQSAADIMYYLIRNYTQSDVTLLIKSFALRPLDDSPFVNKLFGPSATDLIYDLPATARQDLLSEHHNAGYSIVDSELIAKLHEHLYAERFQGRERARIRRFTELVTVREGRDSVEVVARDLYAGQSTQVQADAVILATGYRRDTGSIPFLEPIADQFVHDEAGDFVLSRRYRALANERVRAGLFFQGFAERTHGVADGQLSNIATRAGEIVSEVVSARDRDTTPIDLARALLTGQHHSESNSGTTAPSLVHR
jgi:L-ornithine N5-monooxygenase